ncbi:TonB-dependent receptor [Shewanella submarina]|uniref:TonB-dependent receptor n=1 Tax=Shewanella submarina TaxID=2016376 RepID=A0ABV7GD94_9GAMM|nr:TonB-dependent receptor [Shewanella submarina]MCL1039706.1 TonB-dependent receptor [Shewanella submarina]
MKNNKYSVLSAAIATALSFPAFAADSSEERQPMETLMVTADFRATEIDKVPASISVIGKQQLEDDGGENFQDILNAIPNINWSGGSSRARYFQIRGVGDQEEYEGAPNSSVGFFVDDIDLSGLGMASNLFDIDQVEVLRGPQSTLFGGNALAGAIYLKSAEPTAATEAGVEVSVGTDDLLTIGAYAGGSMNADDTLLGRISVQSHQQNGFMDNQYLGRDDTNARDEVSAKAKLRWYATDKLQADLTLIHGDFDNGYDAWSLDSNGENTYTDRPGKDTQTTNGAGLSLSWEAHKAFNVETITSFADTEQRHAYDGDWSNPEYWAGFECPIYDDNWNHIGDAPCVYDYWWDKTAERQNFSQDVRLLSTEDGRLFNGTTDWLVGLYYNRLSEDNSRYIEDRYADELPRKRKLYSDYSADKVSAFGQLDTYIGNFHYSLGVRVESWSADYFSDGTDSEKLGEDFSESHSHDETLWGGHISVSYALDADQQIYAKISRGYKAGGFNTDVDTKTYPELSQYLAYDPETLYNYEIGHSASLLDGDLTTRVAAFFMDRDDQQVDASIQEGEGSESPGDFILYTANATSSTNYGLEASASYYLTQNLEFYGSVGLLKATYDSYIIEVKEDVFLDLSGRELAHAPSYNYQLGATWRGDTGFFANMNLSGMDSFYYSDSNDFVSDDYHLLNLRLGYEADNWSVYLWGRNLTDEEYGVRGFFFGNEPNKDWADQQYVRYGDPRQLGITFRYDYF